jgi:hypothetical protein
VSRVAKIADTTAAPPKTILSELDTSAVQKIDDSANAAIQSPMLHNNSKDQANLLKLILMVSVTAEIIREDSAHY